MNFLYSVKAKDKEVALSAEELLTMFNRNIAKNAELLDYIGKKNIFGIIKKARNESVHSCFVSELLSGDFFDGSSRESTLTHFLDLLLYRAGVEFKAAEFNDHLRKAVLTRSALFEKIDSICELPVKEYQKRFSKNTNATEKADRIDIYLRYRLQTPLAGRDTLEIFIENKVNSAEFDSQTVRYFEACDNGGFKRPFQLFVFLSPQPIRDMEHYGGLDKKCKPSCPHYIHICYQDILDYIIEPLLADNALDIEKKAMLNEYVSCLELPEMPDADSTIQGNDLSIMAVSSKERSLVQSFMEDPINRRLTEKAISTKIGEPLYKVATFGTLMNSQEAMSATIQMLNNVLGGPLDVLRAVAKCDIVGPQGGSEPFLVYSPESWRSTDGRLCQYLPLNGLYVYSGKVYTSISSAVAVAIRDFKEKHRKTNAEIIQLFSGIYSTKGGGIPLISGKKMRGAKEAGMEGLYVRKKVDEDRLPDINAILGKKCYINLIDNEAYMELLSHNTQVYANVPVTDNELPEEIEKMVGSAGDYTQVGETNYFFRKDILGDRILKINQIKIFEDESKDLIEKCTDTAVLMNFFKSRRNLVLSVYKILLEAETYNARYKEKLAVYKKLLQP